MVQLLCISVYSGPVLSLMNVQPRKKMDIGWDYYKRLILPLAFGKFLASIFSHISIWKVPVSYAHTVKATMPLFTVILARIFFGERQTVKVYFSLVPIILGVALATITELSFNIVGLVSALLATCGFSFLNIFSKKVLNETGIHHLRLLHLLGKLALAMFLPIWAICDIYPIITDHIMFKRIQSTYILGLLFTDGFLSWVQNLLAFSILNRVTPLTYAVANATKRISVITLSLFILGNPVTLPNVVGMFLAILGVLGYNKTKYDDNIQHKKLAYIPLSQVMSVTNKMNLHQNGTLPSNGHISLPNAYYSNPLQVAPFDNNFMYNLQPNNVYVSVKKDKTSKLHEHEFYNSMVTR